MALSDSETGVEVGKGVGAARMYEFEAHDEPDDVRKGLSSACRFRHHGIPCHSFASSKNSKLVDNNV
jgi:hypothetical protein